MLAGLLLREPAPESARREQLSFPRHPREHEIERQARRSTLLLPQAQPAPEALHDRPPPQAQDPLHVALADHEAALVIEASALEESPLGRMLLACLSPHHHEHLRELERRVGLKPFEHIDRIALGAAADDSAPVLILHGDFSNFDPNGLELDAPLSPYGARGLALLDGPTGFALWDGQLILAGETASVRSALARLEGEEPVRNPTAAGEAYGDVYGAISGRAAGRLLPPELRERLETAAQRVALHMDATDDLLLVAQVYGTDAAQLSDLARSIGGALSLARLGAAREEDPVLFDLLEQSRVIPDDGSFQLEMALPLDTIREQLGECARQDAP